MWISAWISVRISVCIPYGSLQGSLYESPNGSLHGPESTPGAESGPWSQRHGESLILIITAPDLAAGPGPDPAPVPDPGPDLSGYPKTLMLAETVCNL